MNFFEKLKNLGKAAIIRLFSKRQKKYDELIARLNSISEINASTSAFVALSQEDSDFGDVSEINIEQVDHVPRKRNKKIAPGTLTISKFVAPNANDLIKNTSDFVETEEALAEIEGMYTTLKAKSTTTLLTGTKLTRKLKSVDLEALKKIDGVSQGINGATSTTDSIIVVLKAGSDKAVVSRAIRAYIKKAIDGTGLSPVGKSSKVGRNDVLTIQFMEGDKLDPASVKFLNQMIVYKTALEKARDAAEDSLIALAEKHVPDDVSALSRIAIKHINDTLDASVYEDFRETLYLTTDKTSLFTFTSYIEILGLNAGNPRENEFQIAITSQVRKTGSTYSMKSYVTGLNQFTRPGDFNVGTEIDSAEIDSANKNKTKFKRELTKILSLSGIQFALEGFKLNISPTAFKASGINELDGVVTSRLLPDRVIVKLNNVDDSIIETEILGKIILILRKLMRTVKGRDKSVFAHQINKSKSGGKVLVVAKVPNN